MHNIRLIAYLALLALSAPTIAETQRGRVVRVSDGDTVMVLTDNKRRVTIRLQGIDAPERTMPYSQVSRRHLSELVLDKIITFDPEKLDRHGRTVAVIRLQDGTDICLAQIQAGLAWHFKRYEMEQSPADRAAYAAAEQSRRQHIVVCGAMIHQCRRGSFVQCNRSPPNLKHWPETYLRIAVGGPSRSLG